jgi:hypothetical protein
MKFWQITVLNLIAAALVFTARPAQAQVWVGVRPIVVVPAWRAVPAWPVARVSVGWPVGWGSAWWGPPPLRPVPVRAAWVGAVRGPRVGVVVAGGRWR